MRGNPTSLRKLARKLSEQRCPRVVGRRTGHQHHGREARERHARLRVAAQQAIAAVAAAAVTLLLCAGVPGTRAQQTCKLLLTIEGGMGFYEPTLLHNDKGEAADASVVVTASCLPAT